jgi:hypothetical protein
MATGMKKTMDSLCKEYLKIGEDIDKLVARQNRLKDILRKAESHDSDSFKLSTWTVDSRSIKIADLEKNPWLWSRVKKFVNSYSFISMRVTAKVGNK